MTSPSDMVGPSPVTSNGTEIEDDIAEDIQDGDISPPALSKSKISNHTVWITIGAPAKHADHLDR
jgi:hypothetical protein